MYAPKDVEDHLKEVHANNYFKNDIELDFKGTKEQLVTQIYSLNAFGYQFYPQFHLVPIKVSCLCNKFFKDQNKEFSANLT